MLCVRRAACDSWLWGSCEVVMVVLVEAAMPLVDDHVHQFQAWTWTLRQPLTTGGVHCGHAEAGRP